MLSSIKFGGEATVNIYNKFKSELEYDPTKQAQDLGKTLIMKQ